MGENAHEEKAAEAVAKKLGQPKAHLRRPAAALQRPAAATGKAVREHIATCTGTVPITHGKSRLVLSLSAYTLTMKMRWRQSSSRQA